MAGKRPNTQLALSIKELEHKAQKCLQAEEALKNSEVRFRELFDNIKSGVAVYELTDDGHFVFIDMNRAGERIGQVRKKDIIGKKVLDVFPGVASSGLYDVFKRVHETGKAECHPVSICQDNRLTRWVQNYVYKLPSGEVVAVFDDVTDQKQMAEALQFKNIILTNQQQNSPDGILVVDADRKMISFNQRFIDMWGIPPQIVESRSSEKAVQSVLNKVVDPEQFLERVMSLYNNIDETGHDEIALKDGRTFDRYSAPMSGPDGKYYGRGWYYRDITRQKQAEQELARRSRELEEVNISLKILLRQATEAKTEFEGKITANLMKLILPYLDDLHVRLAGKPERFYVEAIKANLEQVTSSFSKKLSSELINLTPRETQVADFIRQGKTTKEIAGLLKVSVSTVEYYRNNIRKKLDLKNKKVNLRSYLSSCSS